MPKLTKRSVDGLEGMESDFIVFDAELPGFGVRVMPSGRKTYLVQYRAGGRTRRVKIGLHGILTPEEARKRARAILGDVAHGENPAEGISAERKARTVAEVAERLMTDHVALRCKPTTQREYRRAVDLFIKPALGTHRICDVMRADIAELHHKLRHIPYQANRTLGVLSKMFNLAEVWGLRPDGSNPCRHVPKYRERKRERFLSTEELRRLGEVLDEVEASGEETRSAVHALRLLILTGCRLSEILTLKWDYVRPPYLMLPDSKTGARKIPMDEAIARELARIERLKDNPHVIAGLVRGQHFTDLQHPWQRIREKASLGDVRIHDLRHTYASSALAAGCSLEMVGKLLGHTQYQTTMRYAHLADGPVREAASKVASGLELVLSAPRRAPLTAESSLRLPGGVTISYASAVPPRPGANDGVSARSFSRTGTSTP